MNVIRKFYYGDIPEDKAGGNINTPLGDGGTKSDWPLWEVFIRSKQGLDHKHVGSLHATDAQMAIENARDVYTRRMEGVSIWVVESKYITASNPEEAGELYEPAMDKIYRHPTFYQLPDEVKSNVMSALIDHTLHLADNSLILGQRNAEWCGHGPVLEQDIAITNISLDLVGQARNFYQYAATLKADGSTEDSLAYLRTEREYKNCLLVEQPNGDWAQTILRQYLFSQYQYLLFQQLQNWKDEQIAAIAAKSLKEITYHLRWSREWVIRLGDGTEESQQRMLKAIDELWRYTGEMFVPAGYEKETGVDFNKIKEDWLNKVKAVFTEAALQVPEKTFMQTGGKEGKHTEHLGYILTELQYLQRTYPNCEW